MKAHHTPTPWTYEPEAYHRDNIWAGENIVAQAVGDSAETEANAAYIVLTVNNHSRLVEALAQLIEDAESYTDGMVCICCSGTPGEDEDGNQMDEITHESDCNLVKAKEALSAVREG